MIPLIHPAKIFGVENQARREANINTLSEKFKYKRNVGLIRTLMDVRVRDAYQDLREISREVSRMKRKLHQIDLEKEGESKTANCEPA